MKLHKKKIVFLFGLSIIIALLNINFIGFSNRLLNNEEDLEIRNDSKIKISDYWVENPILIDDTVEGSDWAWAVDQGWCSSVNGFYVIENVTINGDNSSNCIHIKNSNVPFIIRNCTFYNSSKGMGYGGISLENVNNSQIINNNCSFNYGHGIRVYFSYNNIFLGNTANNNSKNGIYMETTQNNTFLGNILINHWNASGIGGWWNDNNTISGNTINNNIFGIFLGECTNNTISGNIEINENMLGIYLHKSNNTDVYGNTINSNGYGIALEMSNYTIVIGNVLIGNGMCIIEEYTIGNIFMGNNCNGIISSFIIDDSGGTSGALTWVQAAKFLPFCNGSGTWNDPYIIEDITINGENSSSCIAIRESNKYFIIRDCKVYNSNSGWGHGGIALFRVNNGMIINNNCTSNYEAGIAIIESHNNTISNNDANNNFGNGMNIWYSDKNAISENTLNDNKGVAGMYILDSSNNIISGNTIIYNDYGVQSDGNSNDFFGNIINFNDVGLQISKSNDSVISENIINNNNFTGLVLNRVNNSTFSDNTIFNSNEGLGLDGCNNNTFFNNDIIENDAKGVSLIEESGKCENNLFYNNNFTNPAGINAVDNGTNNRWDNGEIGNYWHDYTGRDKNDDGIGDTPYNIPGSAGSQDNFPIWDDGPEPTKKDLTWIIVTVIISIVGGIAVIAAIVIIYLRKRTKT